MRIELVFLLSEEGWNDRTYRFKDSLLSCFMLAFIFWNNGLHLEDFHPPSFQIVQTVVFGIFKLAWKDSV